MKKVRLGLDLKRVASYTKPVCYLLITGFAVLTFLSGCATTGTATGQDKGTVAAEKKPEQPTVMYYDFDDILIPKELALQKSESFVFQTPGFYGGVLSFIGAVERNSLIAFFENNMAKDNWQAVGSFKSPKSIMLFKKKNRWCVIKIEERSFDVKVEVWVAPTINENVEDASGGLLK